MDWLVCRAITPVSRGRRRRLGHRCPRPRPSHAQCGGCIERSDFDWACGRSGGTEARAGGRGGAIEPAVRIDQYPRVALGRSDARVGSNIRCRRRLESDGSVIDRYGFAQNGQERKLSFVNASVDRRTTSSDRLASPASPYVVQAGTVISGALITGIRSDLPGEITAQVSENVYDTPTGKYLLVPQGARLIGQYDSQVAFGQSRVLLVWTRLIMPNGKSIVLERQPGADTSGYSGLEDEVDNHWGALFKAALLSTLLSVGSEAGTTGNENALVQAIRRGGSQSFDQVGQRVVSRNLDIQPTLTIRPGFPVRLIVNRDLVLEPYRV
jgi:type IV secretory pathway VirB10-like protein